MCIIFGGDGSYMSPYNLYSDTLLTNLLGQVSRSKLFCISIYSFEYSCLTSRCIPFFPQHVPPTVWNRLVAGLNAQLRTVRHGSIRSALVPVINWIKSHGNPQLEFHGVKIELGWFQATASGYYQLGILVVVGDYSLHNLHPSDLLECGDNCPR